MIHINIDNIASTHGISLDKIADILFPNAKYKKSALERVRKSEANIDIEQAYNLAAHLNVSIDSLIIAPYWKGTRENGFITIVRDGYRVIFNKDGFYYSVYHGDTLLEQVVHDLGPMRLSEFITHINSLISKYENDGTENSSRG